jgi:hypothetical protein
MIGIGIPAFLLLSVLLYWISGKTPIRKKKLERESQAVQSSPNYSPTEGGVSP